MALDKFQYLLHHKQFTLQTDSKNLTFLNNSTNSRVYRWKLAIQKFSFNLEQIAGEKNIAADGFSRLVKNNAEESEYSTVLMAAFADFNILPVHFQDNC